MWNQAGTSPQPSASNALTVTAVSPRNGAIIGVPAAFSVIAANISLRFSRAAINALRLSVNTIYPPSFTPRVSRTAGRTSLVLL